MSDYRHGLPPVQVFNPRIYESVDLKYGMVRAIYLPAWYVMARVNMGVSSVTDLTWPG